MKVEYIGYNLETPVYITYVPIQSFYDYAKLLDFCHKNPRAKFVIVCRETIEKTISFHVHSLMSKNDVNSTYVPELDGTIWYIPHVTITGNTSKSWFCISPSDNVYKPTSLVEYDSITADYRYYEIVPPSLLTDDTNDDN